MTRKKMFFGLALLLLGLANGYAADKDAPAWRTRWKEAITRWTETKETTEERGTIGAAAGALVGNATGTQTAAPAVAESLRARGAQIGTSQPYSTTTGPTCVTPVPCVLPPVPALSPLPPLAPPCVDPCVEQAAFEVPSEPVAINLCPPIGLFGQLASFLGAHCAEAMCMPVVSGTTLPSARYVEHLPQYVSPPTDCGRPTPPMGCGTGICMPCPPAMACPPSMPCPAAMCCPPALPRPVMPCPALPPVSYQMVAPPPPVQMPYPTPLPYVVPQYVPVPPPVAVSPVSISLVETKKGKMLQVALQDGTTIRCKKMELTPAQDDKLTVRVVNNQMKISSADFNGTVDKVMIHRDGSVQFNRAAKECQTGVITNPQLAQ